VELLEDEREVEVEALLELLLVLVGGGGGGGEVVVVEEALVVEEGGLVGEEEEVSLDAFRFKETDVLEDVGGGGGGEFGAGDDLLGGVGVLLSYDIRLLSVCSDPTRVFEFEVNLVPHSR